MLQIFHKKSSKGFTLIELLVVIAIIGVLASIVLASLNTARRKGRDAKRVADLKQIQTALELYFDASAAYPAALTSLVPAYLPTVPVDPLATASYVYYSAGTTTYHLGATLEEVSNAALKSDRDLEIAAPDTIDGLSTVANCGSDAAATVTTDLCYDLVP